MPSRLLFILITVGVISLVAGLRSQTPAPIIIQAQTTTTAPVTSTRPAPASPAAEEAIALLKEIKATNEETIKKQQAALEAMDTLQKSADQLRIFARRG